MALRLLKLAEQLDEGTMQQLFTHASLVADRGASYERLEFLGDSVLSLCITTDLYRRFPQYPEGHLARLRAYVVSRATCAKVAAKLGLGRMMRERSGGTPGAGEMAQLVVNQNILADLTESLIGALYVTFGFEAVRPAVVEAFAEHIAFAEKSYVDHKTELQEFLARAGKTVVYHLLGYTGPPHDREFEIEALVEGERFGHGLGASKKRAEQEAAEEALKTLSSRERRVARRVRVRGRSHSGGQTQPEAGPDRSAADSGGGEA